MSQDVNACLMGSSQSSAKDISQHNVDPASFRAGLKVCMGSDGLPSLLSSAGMPIGISMGPSLSDTKKLAVLRCGERVPVLIEAAPARGVVTITSYANLVVTSGDTLKVGATTFTAQSSAVSHGGATFRAATGNTETAASLADQINNHAVAGALFIATPVAAVVTITAKNNATLGASIDLVYTDTHSVDIGLTVDAITFTGGGATAADYVVKGAKVYFSNTTGKADDPNSDSVISDAIYVSAVLSGIDEDGNSVAAAMVDMTGGL